MSGDHKHCKYCGDDLCERVGGPHTCATTSKTRNEVMAVRDRAIARLWLAYRDMSEVVESDLWTDEDLDLWGAIANHSSVQRRIKQGM